MIYGCNRLTGALAPVLMNDGHEVTVVDPDSDRLEILRKQTKLKTIRVSEPLMQDYLLEGGIEASGAFYALTGDDHLNVLLCQLASHIFNVPNVLCRLEDPQLQDLYRDLGVNILDNGPNFLSSARDLVEE